MGKDRKKSDRKKGDKKNDKAKLFRRKKRRPCFFCVEKTTPEYKDIELVQRFINDRGKILPRRASGCCSKHQAMVARSVKRARHVGLLPFTAE